MFLKSRRAQNTLEYALLISALVLAVVAIQYYVRRGLQGRLKDSADNLGEQLQIGNYSAQWNTSTVASTQERAKDGVTSTVFLGTDKENVQTRYGDEKIEADVAGYNK